MTTLSVVTVSSSKTLNFLTSLIVVNSVNSMKAIRLIECIVIVRLQFSKENEIFLQVFGLKHDRIDCYHVLMSRLHTPQNYGKERLK